jgi:hypothetical protein
MSVVDQNTGFLSMATMAVNQPQSFRFLELPRELRDQVYSYLWQIKGQGFERPGSQYLVIQVRCAPVLSLLLTCRQIYYEYHIMPQLRRLAFFAIELVRGRHGLATLDNPATTTLIVLGSLSGLLWRRNRPNGLQDMIWRFIGTGLMPVYLPVRTIKIVIRELPGDRFALGGPAEYLWEWFDLIPWPIISALLVGFLLYKYYIL